MHSTAAPDVPISNHGVFTLVLRRLSGANTLRLHVNLAEVEGRMTGVKMASRRARVSGMSEEIDGDRLNRGGEAGGDERCVCTGASDLCRQRAVMCFHHCLHAVGKVLELATEVVVKNFTLACFAKKSCECSPLNDASQ